MPDSTSSPQTTASAPRVAPARVQVERVNTRVISVPAEEQPESDGTLTWNETTMVLVECTAGGVTGIGYSYVHAAAAALVRSMLADCVRGVDAMAVGEAHMRMQHAIRNQGREGVVAAAISAVDVALWDLKARLLNLPLAMLLGTVRYEVPVYASGGLTSSGPEQLQQELEGYVRAGHRRTKIKVGREPVQDPVRVRLAREAVGHDVDLMVDANGAYTRKQALALANTFSDVGVVWFEEPVSSDDLAGLNLLRNRAPAGMAIAAGEYGYVSSYFERMLRAQTVDILQADATRCGGVTGFMRANALCDANLVPLSAHCAPTLHAHLGAAASRLVHLEYFKDHVRMEGLLFEGGPTLVNGSLRFDPTRAGLGISLRQDQVARYELQ